MKLNFKVFKKGKPIYWVLGGIVLFVVFYLYFNRGGGGSTQYVQGGESEAVTIAKLNAGIAQSQFQAQIGLQAAGIAAQDRASQLAANVELAKIAAGESVAGKQLTAEQAMTFASLDTTKAIAALNASYNLESARVASEAALAAKTMDNNLLIHQMDTNKEMFAIQSDNLIKQTVISQIPSLKSKDRDKALRQFMELSYAPDQYQPVIY